MLVAIFSESSIKKINFPPQSFQTPRPYPVPFIPAPHPLYPRSQHPIHPLPAPSIPAPNPPNPRTPFPCLPPL